MSLPGAGSVTYNGISFPSESNTKANFRYVYDAAGRTVVQTTLTLTVTAHVLAGATQDTQLDAIRAALERNGGQLVVSGLGFGTLAINTAGGRRDLAWGPKPLTMAWEPTGGNRAARIVWTVEVAVLGCLDSADEGAVMESTYSVTFATDKGGWYTRTFQGEIRIPLTKVNVNSAVVPDTVDAYFEAHIPAKPAGAERTITRNIDASFARMSITVVDAQRPGNPLPAGVVDATASHTMQSTGRYVTIAWTGTISAAYELEAFRARSDAFELFLKLVHDRVKPERDRGAVYMPMSMSIGEPEIYGRQCAAFTLTYACNFIKPKAQGLVDPIFPTVGLWRPPPGDTWDKWSDSLKNGAQHPRGLSDVRHFAADGRVTDLCLPAAHLVGRPISDVRLRGRQVDPRWAQLKTALGLDGPLRPEGTWLLWENRAVIEPIDNVVPHVPLATKRDTESRLRTPNMNRFEHQGPGFRLVTQASPPPIFQTRASPSYYVRMIGRAVRYHFPIPRPELGKVAGSTVQEANHPSAGCFWSHWLGSWTASPIWAAQWNLRWFVVRQDGAAAGDVPDMPFPFQQDLLDNE